MDCPLATKAEGSDVLLDRHPVQLDRSFNRGGANRNRPDLHRHTHRQNVGRRRTTKQAAADCRGVEVTVHLGT